MSESERKLEAALVASDERALPLPLQRLVALLPDDTEEDARWGARRQGERIPFCKPVELKRAALGAAATGFEGWALNVCHGGMRIITEERLEVGDEVELEVSAGAAYSGSARVRWIHPQADGVVAGLAFVRRT